MKNVILKSINTILILTIIFAPLQFDFFYIQKYANANYGVLEITQDTTWNSNTDLSQYESVEIMWDATVTIEPGSNIKIRNIVLKDIGRIVAEGTIDNPITFTKIPYDTSNQYDEGCFSQGTPSFQFDGYASQDYSSDPSIFKFVNFEGLGEYFDKSTLNCPGITFNNFFIKSAYAQEEDIVKAPAIQFNAGKATMENVIFNNNKSKDIEVNMNLQPHQTETSYLHIKNSNFNGNSDDIAIDSNVIKYNENYDINNCYDECHAQNNIDSCYEACDANSYTHLTDRVLLENNWYGDKTGPIHKINLADTRKGKKLLGDLTLNPFDWRGSPDFASSVIFLPGAKASKLHNDDNQVWPPTPLGDDYKELLLDEDGNSIENIYTDYPIDETALPNPLGVNIYKSFINDLEQLKDERIIRDYSLYAYDWRKSVDDIAKNGTSYENEITKNAISQIETLADSSTSGKITIVAHSNGGLLAKAIMQELKEKNEQDLVDNIILASSPQMGTPKAILTMLYGFDEKLPIPGLITNSQARQVVQNMPGAYGLLPSQEYFNRNKQDIIRFNSENTDYKKYKDAYGQTIDNYQEFRDFLLAKKDNRQKPDKEDTAKANVLNEKLFDKNTQLQQQLNNWTPPENVNLIQIGGWGLDTISGVEYNEKPHEDCAYNMWGKWQCNKADYYDAYYDPIYTVDGDNVVVTPSSLALEESDNVQRYWLDLYDKNYGRLIGNTHRNILEIKQLRNLIKNIIQKHKEPEQLSDYITKNKPNYAEAIKNSDHSAKRMRMSLYSPLDIHLYDKDGNHTGPVIDSNGNKTIEQNIPNSYYDTVEEHKYVGWGASSDVKVELRGYDTGSYTIKLKEITPTQNSEEITSQLTMKNLPTSKNTKVTFAIPETGLKNITNLTADYDGDGNTDYTVKPKLNQEVTLDETQGQDDVISTEASSEVEKSQNDDDKDDDTKKVEHSDSEGSTLDTSNNTTLDNDISTGVVDETDKVNAGRENALGQKSQNNNTKQTKQNNKQIKDDLNSEISNNNQKNITKYILITIIFLSIIVLSIFIFKKLIK